MHTYLRMDLPLVASTRSDFEAFFLLRWKGTLSADHNSIGVSKNIGVQFCGPYLRYPIILGPYSLGATELEDEPQIRI